MSDEPALDVASMFERLQGLLLQADDLHTILVETAHLAAGVVTSAKSSCGITVRYEDNLFTAGSSDAQAEMLDESQYRVGGGPCLESLRTGAIVDSADSRAELRWPEYLTVATQAGLRCSLSLPLTVGGDTFGAMNLYGFEQPRLFGEPERRVLRLFAAQTAGTLFVARRLVKDGELLRQMDQAMLSRTVIDQALGILMAQQRCDATTAFDLLRHQSQTMHRRLRDIAADLVERVSGQPPEPGREFVDD